MQRDFPFVGVPRSARSTGDAAVFVLPQPLAEQIASFLVDFCLDTKHAAHHKRAGQSVLQIAFRSGPRPYADAQHRWGPVLIRGRDSRVRRPGWGSSHSTAAAVRRHPVRAARESGSPRAPCPRGRPRPCGGVSVVRIRVLVVDDHRIFAESLAAALAAEPDVDVSAAGSGPAALRCLERAAAEGRRFDVLLVDADLGALTAPGQPSGASPVPVTEHGEAGLVDGISLVGGVRSGHPARPYRRARREGRPAPGRARAPGRRVRLGRQGLLAVSGCSR